jgi:hypothetical protein
LVKADKLTKKGELTAEGKLMNERNQDTWDEYFYPSLELDGMLYTYDECEQTFRISQ